MAPRDENAHARFSEYAKRTTDVHWKSQFISMSKGEFPSGFSLSSSGNTIVSEDGRKLRLYPDDDPDKIFDNSVNVRKFIEGGKEVVSPRKTAVSEWKSIKSKEARYHLISDFSKNLQFDPEKRRRTVDQINFCIQIRMIGPSDIHMKRGKIVSIDGLKIDKSGNVVIPQISIPKKGPVAKKKKNLLRVHIEKMIKENHQRLEKISP